MAQLNETLFRVLITEAANGNLTIQEITEAKIDIIHDSCHNNPEGSFHHNDIAERQTAIVFFGDDPYLQTIKVD